MGVLGAAPSSESDAAHAPAPDKPGRDVVPEPPTPAPRGLLAAVTNPPTTCDLVDGDDGVFRPDGESYEPGPGLSAPGLEKVSPASDRPKVPLRLDGDGEDAGTIAS